MNRTYSVVGICFILFGPISCQEKSDPGLVAYYPFNGDARDQSGNENHGVVDGPVLTMDRFGQENSVFHFDGEKASIEANVKGMPEIDSPQSFSWWFRINTNPTYINELGADNMIALVDSGKGIGIQFGFRAPGYKSLGLDTWNWGGGTLLEAELPALKKWHHCVYTYDGLTHRFYINGAEVGLSTAKTQQDIPNMLMFRNYPSGDQYFSGELDDVRIYNRNLNPVWKLTFEAAKQYNLRVGFRVQLSSPNFQPKQLSMPDFLQDKIPLVKIGSRRGETNEKKEDNWDYIEPRYDHPAFKNAFQELNDLLVAEYNDHPQMEFMDMMMYGFWGEGHTNALPNPFPDYLTAEKTMVEMTQYQIDTWTKVPLANNTQPDISNTGNRECLDMAVRAGNWLRSDSIVNIEEPIQIERLSNRPPWLATVMEQGRFRHYNIDDIPLDKAGINLKEKSMLHCLDMSANHWALWTEGDNLKTYYEKYPNGFDTLHRRLGYRVRPSWIWQRKRYGTSEVVLAIANDGVAGVPGILRVYVESMDGKLSIGGGLDAGHPHGGRLRQCNFVLPQGMEGKKLKVRAEIETKGVRRKVNWACAQPLNEDGSLTIQLKTFDEPGWRKGI